MPCSGSGGGGGAGAVKVTHDPEGLERGPKLVMAPWNGKGCPKLVMAPWNGKGCPSAAQGRSHLSPIAPPKMPAVSMAPRSLRKSSREIGCRANCSEDDEVFQRSKS